MAKQIKTQADFTDEMKRNMRKPGSRTYSKEGKLVSSTNIPTPFKPPAKPAPASREDDK